MILRRAAFGGVKMSEEKHLTGSSLRDCLNVFVSDLAVRKRRGFQKMTNFSQETDGGLLFPQSLQFMPLPGSVSQGVGGVDVAVMSADSVDAGSLKHYTVRNEDVF